MNADKLTALLNKYDRPGPRYTSYPTVPVWTDQFDADEYKKALSRMAKKTDESLSFYLHIPFCKKRCWFCGCNTTTLKSEDRHTQYLNAVENEAELVLAQLDGRKNVAQLHWGGGTPSCMNAELTEKAFKIFSNKFNFNDQTEISIELDPRVTDRKKIDLLKELGFNRLSFGIQDFNAEVQVAIGRNQDQNEAIDLYNYCRDSGFGGINFDLIYGLPLQTMSRFRETLRQTIELKPDRVAMYSFAYLPNSKLHQKKIDPQALPAAANKLELFLTAREMFLEEGYCQIGLDHFVLPTDELAIAQQEARLRRNFMGYTVLSTVDWIGLGMSSISYVDDCFAQNVSTLKDYQELIEDSKLAVYRGLKLSSDDKLRQTIISELMCNFSVHIRKIETDYAINFEQYFQDEISELVKFIDDGLLTLENDVYQITETGKLFIRNIAMEFDIYLRQGNLNVQFSRTV